MDEKKNKRGRPLKSNAEQEAVRRKIIDATRAVFIAEGYHGLSVELILTQCGLSRPTFYKYFRHTDEPIDIVLREANDQLINSMTNAVNNANGLFSKIEVALATWRQWGDDMGPMLKPLFSELHDIHSPTSKHRLRALELVASALAKAALEEGKPVPSRISIDVLINCVEFLGYRFQLETAKDEISWQQTRSAMLRLASGLLGSEAGWNQASDLKLIKAT